MIQSVKIALGVALLIVAGEYHAQAQSFKKVNIPSVTTLYAPTLNGNADKIVFQTNNNKYEAWQLFESDHKNGRWQKPRSLTAINGYGVVPQASNNFQGDFIGTPCLNHRGDTLYFSATFQEGQGGKDLYYSVRHDSAWSEPINLGRQINTAGGEESPSISADGQTLYFTRQSGSRKDKTQSCYAIYSSVKNNEGEWSKPVALPFIINQGCEKAPRILGDNVTLVFSSMRDGRDNFDLYVSVKSLTGAWTTPQRVSELSTDQPDFYVNVSRVTNRIYFNTSTNNSSALCEYPAIPGLLRQQKFYNLTVSLVDSVTGEALKGEIKLSSENGSRELLNHWRAVTGFTKKVYGQTLFRITAEAPGYERKYLLADMQNQGEHVGLKVPLRPVGSLQQEARPAKNTSRTLFDADAQSGLVLKVEQEYDTFAIATNLVAREKKHAARQEPSKMMRSDHGEGSILVENILFGTGEHQLSPEASDRLMAFVDHVRKDKGKRIEIVGYTDDAGAEAFNQELSVRRSIAVKNYLLKMGVSENQIITKAVGETRPVVPNTSGENRAINRRASVSIR